MNKPTTYLQIGKFVWYGWRATAMFIGIIYFGIGLGLFVWWLAL